MRVISFILLIISIFLKIGTIHLSFINSYQIRYLFAFSIGLFVYAFLKPHIDIFFYNKEKVDDQFIKKSVPELLDKDIDIYSSDMLFKPNLFAIKKRKPIIIIDNSILNNLSEQEIRFFIFHEYSHIKDNDSFKMHITSLCAFTIVPLLFFIVIPKISLPTNFISILPFIIMFVSLYFTGVILSFKYKRSIELKCDSYASNYVEKKNIKNAFQKFIRLDIFNYKKRGMLSSHPSLNERLNNLNIQIKKGGN